MFKINDIVVYKRDVCRIKDIFINSNDKYYVLVPESDKSLVIKIPVNNSKLIRKTISKDYAIDFIKKIPQISVISNIDDRSIEQEYKQLLFSGNHEDLIKIIKTAYVRNSNRIKNKKKISEKDDTYFQMAERILYDEFSVALDMSYDQTKEYISNKVKKIIGE